MSEGSFILLKWCMFIYNGIFAILGLALLITASVVLSDTKDLLGDYGHFAESEIKGPAGLMVFVGLVIFVVAATGALGALRENRCLILTFASLITFLVILEFSGSIAAYAYRNEVRDFAEGKMMDIVDKFNGTWPDDDPLVVDWNAIQSDLQCCGVTDKDDYDGDLVPWSCCGKNAESEPNTCSKATEAAKIYNHGCLDTIVDKFKSQLGTIGGFSLAMLFIQVFGIVSGFLFSGALRKRHGSIA